MGPSGFEGVKRPEAHHERPEPMRVWLLGSFRVSVGSRTVEGDAWHLRKAAALVKLLALSPDHRLHRERAMDLLWPNLGTKAASNNLRQVLYGARRVLDPASDSHNRYLSLQDEQLVLCPEGDLRVDVDAFEEAVEIPAAPETRRLTKQPSSYTPVSFFRRTATRNGQRNTDSGSGRLISRFFWGLHAYTKCAGSTSLPSRR